MILIKPKNFSDRFNLEKGYSFVVIECDSTFESM